MTTLQCKRMHQRPPQLNNDRNNVSRNRKSKLNKLSEVNNQPATTEADWRQQQQNKNTSGNKQQWQISDCNSNVLSFTNKIQPLHSCRLEDICTTPT